MFIYQRQVSPRLLRASRTLRKTGKVLLLIVAMLPALARRVHFDFERAPSITDVRTWAHRLQNADPHLIASSGFDLIIMGYSQDGTDENRYTKDIEVIKKSGGIPIAYISIGEAEDYRFYRSVACKTLPSGRARGGGWVVKFNTSSFAKEFGVRFLEFKLPKTVVGKKIKEVRILPRCKGLWFEIEHVYEVEPEKVDLGNKYLSIDLGLDNFATCISTSGTPFIIEGRGLKSFNRWWNKEKVPGITGE